MCEDKVPLHSNSGFWNHCKKLLNFTAQKFFEQDLVQAAKSAQQEFDNRMSVIGSRISKQQNFDQFMRTLSNWRAATKPSSLDKSKSWLSVLASNAHKTMFFAAPYAKYRIIFLGKDKGHLTTEIFAPTQNAEQSFVKLKLTFSSSSAAALAGSLIEKALLKTHSQRGLGLPLMGATWEIDFERARELDPENPFLDRHSKKPLIFYAPFRTDDFPAISLNLPIFREAKGYDLFLANLVHEVEQVASKTVRDREIDVHEKFYWNTSTDISETRHDKTQAMQLLKKIHETSVLSGYELYMLSHSMLTTLVNLDKQGRSNEIKIKKIPFPVIKNDEAARLIDGQKAITDFDEN